MRRTTFAVLGGCLLLSSVGCRRLEEAYQSYEASKSTTGSTSISMATVRTDGATPADAERMIAVARCSRELACAKIRGRQNKITREQCEREVGLRVRTDLAAPSCQAGIGREALDECLGELGAEDCDRDLVPATRIAACQPKILCTTKR